MICGNTVELFRFDRRSDGCRVGRVGWPSYAAFTEIKVNFARDFLEHVGPAIQTAIIHELKRMNLTRKQCAPG